MVVDDDVATCHFLQAFLAERGCSAVSLHSADEAVKLYHVDRPAVVILDVVMPGSMDGLGALAAFKKIDRDVPVIVLSGQGRTATVVQAMKLGATDFVNKPFDDGDLDASLAHALKQHELTRELASLREQLQLHSTYSALFGHSEPMTEVQDLIERAAATNATVLIRGERGTGKDVVARALHGSSPRRDKPFVKVNCTALPADLLESELFGLERGAFAGAIQQKPGKFEFASHGTMFLDDVGEIGPALQAKVLRILQDGEFSRPGSTHDVRVDVRGVAATSRNLEQAVADGRFREDLYARLNTISINLPPLRDRREDVPALAEHFLKKYSVQYNKPSAEISPETMRLFMDYDWPGNIRELENVVKRVVVLGSEAPIRKEITQTIAAAPLEALVPAAVPGVPVAPPTPTSVAAAAAEAGNYSLKDISRTAAREAERELIFKMLQQTHWNRKETAEILGISYKALLYKIKESGLDKAS
jgi:two-component system response regulator AtoC